MLLKWNKQQNKVGQANLIKRLTKDTAGAVESFGPCLMQQALSRLLADFQSDRDGGSFQCIHYLPLCTLFSREMKSVWASSAAF